MKKERIYVMLRRGHRVIKLPRFAGIFHHERKAWARSADAGEFHETSARTNEGRIEIEFTI
jgi:hypothetical protein